jgi:hypothetical protein
MVYIHTVNLQFNNPSSRSLSRKHSASLSRGLAKTNPEHWCTYKHTTWFWIVLPTDRPLPCSNQKRRWCRFVSARLFFSHSRSLCELSSRVCTQPPPLQHSQGGRAASPASSMLSSQPLTRIRSTIAGSLGFGCWMRSGMRCGV